MAKTIPWGTHFDGFLFFAACLGLGSVTVESAAFFCAKSTASFSERPHGDLFCGIFRAILGILEILDILESWKSWKS